MIACLRTAYAAQGLTLHGGVVVDLRRASGLSDDDWWLAIYVVLRGPPTHLIWVTEMLEQRAHITSARYSDVLN